MSTRPGETLRQLAEKAQTLPPFESASETMARRKVELNARRTLDALAPALAVWASDVGAALEAEVDYHERYCEDCGHEDIRADCVAETYRILLARLRAVEDSAT